MKNIKKNIPLTENSNKLFGYANLFSEFETLYNNENLPIASTCEYLIKIPEYKSQEQFKRKLEQAIPCSLFNKY